MIKKKLKKLFSKNFVHPVLYQKLSTAIDDKINKIKSDQEKEKEKYSLVLNMYLHTYFSKKYDLKSDMSLAFQEANKQWKTLCKQVNSTNKLINLNKHAFENKVKLVLEEMSKTK